MKRNVVLLILMCLSLAFFAETMTHMMLVNGRRWYYREFYLSQNGSSPNDSTYPMDTVYRNIIIDGPYEFDGKQCYKSVNLTLEETTTFFYEEGSKVYVYGLDVRTNEYGWREEFNFDLIVGDKNCYDIPVLSVDTICVNGEYYRRLKFYNDTWVEGIGSLNCGIYNSMGIVPGTFLGSEVVSVYDGDKCVFTTDDFKQPPATGMPVIQSFPKSDAAIYDLHGRRLTGKPGKGLYIQNGRKMVGK